MSKECDNLKKDLNKLYDILRSEEAKTSKRLKQQDDNLNKSTTDVSLLNSNMQTLIDNLSNFIDKFDEHDREEMKKYNAIENINRDIGIRLKSLEDKDEFQSEAIDDMSKNQNKFFKIIYIGTGIFIGLGAVFSTIFYILDILSKLPK